MTHVTTTTPPSAHPLKRAWRLGALVCILLLTPACSPVSVLNAFVPSEGYALHEGLAYGSAERQVLDLYVPEGTAPDAPVVIFFYGGSWKNGSRETYRFIGEALARQGFLVAVPDYRLYPEVRFPDFVEDGAKAVRWVSDHAAAYGGDPDRLILMGHSAGAHTAALLAFDQRYLERTGVPSSSIRGLVGVAGPYSFDPLAYDSIRPIFADMAQEESVRPITYVNGTEIATLLLHGEADTTVYPRNSRDFAQRIQETGGDVTLLEYPDIGHIKIILSYAAPFRGRDTVYADTMRFLSSI
ncbi:MAG: alpha/beta hydrolase [Pseudomonadota bacterium]